MPDRWARLSSYLDPMKRRTFLLSSMATAVVTATANARDLMPVAEGKGFKVAAGESRTGEHIHMMGVTANVLDVKISSGDTDGRLSVLEQIGHTPKGGPPLHIHPHQDELFYVVEGDYQFQVGEERFELTTGDTIFLPRGVPHAFAQRTEAARMIVTYQPSGKMEAFFRRTAEFTSPPTPQEVAAVFAEHDMTVVGPPLTLER